MSTEHPSFLIFCVDQMRADHMGCDGNPVIQTPNLDRIAADGVRFSQAFVNNPLCMPGRATLFTGLTPRGHRVRTNGIPLDPAFPTVPAALAEAGYATASIGKIHLSPFSLRREFARTVTEPQQFPECGRFWREGLVKTVPVPYYGLQHVELTIGHGAGVEGQYLQWLEQERPGAVRALQTTDPEASPLGAEGCATFPIEDRYHHTAYVAERTMAYLRSRGTRQPFYLMCSFPDPHHPYYVPPPWDRMYSRDDIASPVSKPGESEELAPFFQQVFASQLLVSGRREPTDMPDEHRREILAYTYGMVSLIDHYVGRVLDCLDELGLSEDTVVAFVSDHGDLMGDHGLLNKGPFHFDGLLRVPMIWRLPRRFRAGHTTAFASLLDFAPTVLDLAGVPVPEGPASSEAPQQPPAWPGHSIVPVLTGQADSVQDSVVVENDEDYLGLRLRTLITAEHKITTYTGHRGPEPYGELFDREEDPHELHNLWNSGEHQSVKKDLIERLHYRLVETDIAVPRRLSHA